MPNTLLTVQEYGRLWVEEMSRHMTHLDPDVRAELESNVRHIGEELGRMIPLIDAKSLQAKLRKDT